MTDEEFDGLQAGDIIRHRNASQGYIVHSNYKSGGVLIVRSQLASNPPEWDLILKADYSKEK